MSALLLAALLLAPPATATPAPASGPRLVAEPAAFDFGKVVQERTLNKQFELRNFGTADLVIENVATTCGCTAALLDDKVVKPGGRATLRVTLETRRYTGKVARSVLVKSNDPEHPTVELKLEATVAPDTKK